MQSGSCGALDVMVQRTGPLGSSREVGPTRTTTHTLSCSEQVLQKPSTPIHRLKQLSGLSILYPLIYFWELTTFRDISIFTKSITFSKSPFTTFSGIGTGILNRLNFVGFHFFLGWKNFVSVLHEFWGERARKKSSPRLFHLAGPAFSGV